MAKPPRGGDIFEEMDWQKKAKAAKAKWEESQGAGIATSAGAAATLSDTGTQSPKVQSQRHNTSDNAVDVGTAASGVARQSSGIEPEKVSEDETDSSDDSLDSSDDSVNEQLPLPPAAVQVGGALGLVPRTPAPSPGVSLRRPGSIAPSPGALHGLLRSGSSAGALAGIGRTPQQFRPEVTAPGSARLVENKAHIRPNESSGMPGVGHMAATTRFQPPFDAKPPDHLDLFEGLQWSKDQRAAKEAWERESEAFEF